MKKRPIILIGMFFSLAGGIFLWDIARDLWRNQDPLIKIFVDFRFYAGIIFLGIAGLLTAKGTAKQP
jgi:hypothetical protein